MEGVAPLSILLPPFVASGSTLNRTRTVYHTNTANIYSFHMFGLILYSINECFILCLSTVACLQPETALFWIFCVWLMLILCNGLWPLMGRIMILFCTLRRGLLTSDIYTRPVLCTLSQGCRKTSTIHRLITTAARCSPSHLLHTFPEIRVLLREMWGNTA